MCYNIETSIATFISGFISGIVALALKQTILGCLILSYALMQFSEIIIWRGIDTDNVRLNKIGTAIGKYTLPSHNIALGLGVLITYWAYKNEPKYWFPLVAGVLFYISILIYYSKTRNKGDDVTKACKYPEEKESCTKNSARLEWPYPHSWYSISYIISILILIIYIKPTYPLSVFIAAFFTISFIATSLLGKKQIVGSYWCWSASALAPLLVLVVYLLSRGIKGVRV